MRQYCRSKMDHLKRYGGKGVWAMVTGATDGIGLEFCKQLAEEGFNICLVSRTESKLKGVVENDLAKYGVKTRIVVADFSDGNNMDFYQRIIDQVQDIDIGLVVLNAGISNKGYFLKADPKVQQTTMTVNTYHVGATLLKLAEKLEKRGKRSGIIVSSSITAQAPLPGNFVYCGTKVFARFLVEAIAMES